MCVVFLCYLKIPSHLIRFICFTYATEVVVCAVMRENKVFRGLRPKETWKRHTFHVVQRQRPEAGSAWIPDWCITAEAAQLLATWRRITWQYRKQMRVSGGDLYTNKFITNNLHRFRVRKTLIDVSSTVCRHRQGTAIFKDICRFLIWFFDWKWFKSVKISS